jgi:ribonuclease-3
VREETLALVAKEIDLWKHILVSKGEQKSQGREKAAILSDTLEAVIGYLFIEWGYDAAQAFVLEYIYKYISDIGKLLPVKSYKARIQEHSQQLYKKLPVYTQTEHKIEETGNVLQYKSVLSINDQKVSEWIAQSKKKAQEAAAKKFWEEKEKESG